MTIKHVSIYNPFSFRANIRVRSELDLGAIKTYGAAKYRSLAIIRRIVDIHSVTARCNRGGKVRAPGYRSLVIVGGSVYRVVSIGGSGLWAQTDIRLVR